jgi:hypothetical protein
VGEVIDVPVDGEGPEPVQFWPDESPEEPVVAEPDEEGKQPGGSFSWGKAAVLLLGILSLAGVASMRYLPGASAKETYGAQSPGGARVLDHPPAKNENREKLLNIFFIVSVSTAGLALFGFVLSLVRKQLGLAALLTAYPAVLASGGILVLCTIGLLAQLDEIERHRGMVTREKGTLDAHPGLDLYAGVGSAGAATVLLAVAILLIHRRLWARIVFGTLAVLGLLGAAGFIYLAKTEATSHRTLAPPMGSFPSAVALKSGSGRLVVIR